MTKCNIASAKFGERPASVDSGSSAGESLISRAVYHPIIQRMEVSMRTIGHRKELPIGLLSSGALLAQGARFNDELSRLPTGDTTFVPKGVYRFKTHEEANQHQENCLARGMAKTALERANGRHE